MKKPFSFSSVIAVMVVSDTSSALRCSFSPVSRDVCGEVVCEFETPRLIVKLTARKHYDCRPKRRVRYKFPAIIRPREPPVNCGWIGIEKRASLELPEVGFSFFAADQYYETLSSLGALFMDCSAISEDPTYLASVDEIYRAFSP